MTVSFRLLVSAAALASLTTALPALAADYDPPIIEQPVEEVPVEVGSGWYLRGDVGYNFSTDADEPFAYRTFDAATGFYNPALFDTGSLSDELTWGVGFGYNFTDMIRADLTVDAFRLDFNGSTSSNAPCVDPVAFPTFAGTGCRSADAADGAALSVLANGYVDLGTYVGFTPYLGAGLGFTYVNWDPLASSTFCTGVTCPVGFVAGTESEGESSWRFTYALMAGVAYDVSQNLKVDVGYRFRQIEGGPMFRFDPGTIAAGATGTQGRDPDFTTQEFRVGFRYSLW